MTQALGQTWEQELLQRGMERGVEEGTLLARREDLRALLEGRFGPLPPAVALRIDQAEDAERLRASLIRVLQMKTLDELQL